MSSVHAVHAVRSADRTIQTNEKEFVKCEFSFIMYLNDSG